MECDQGHQDIPVCGTRVVSFLQHSNRLIHFAIGVKRHTVDIRVASRAGLQLGSLREQIKGLASALRKEYAVALRKECFTSLREMANPQPLEA